MNIINLEINRNCLTGIHSKVVKLSFNPSDNREIYRGHPPFSALAARLRWLALGAARHALAGAPPLSERAWLHYCGRAWETINKCTFFLEYERFLP